MATRTLDVIRRRPITTAAAAALTVLTTVAAAWVWAHEGHQALPTQGVLVDAEKGTIILSPKSRATLDVQTGEVVAQRPEGQVMALATVVAPWKQHAYLTSRVAGKVAAVHVQPGQLVTQGQILAEIDSLELENLQLDLLDTQNTVRLSGKNLEQLQDFVQRGAVSDKSLGEAEVKHQQNRNALEMARAKLLSLGVGEDRLEQLLQAGNAHVVRTLPIRSSLTGVVTHVDIGIGQVVEPVDHLLEVVDLATVWVKIGILEKDLARVRVGQTVEIDWPALAGPQKQVSAEVRIKGLALDPRTHWGTVWAELANPNRRLLPGMVGQARVRIPAALEALRVPAASLVSHGAERFVFVEEGPGQYRRRNVVVEEAGEDAVFLAADTGLYPGDRVLTAGSHELATFFVQGVLRVSSEAARTIRLRVEPAQRQPVADVVQLSATVELPPQRRAVVSPRLAGTVWRIFVDRDQPVRAGEVVAEVASLQLQNWQLELLRTHLDATFQESMLGRMRSLYQRGVAVERALREAESAALASQQRRDSLRRKLLAAGLSDGQVRELLEERKFAQALPVRAPIDGTVVRFQAVLGQSVKAEDTLFEIHNLTGAGVQAYVPERDLGSVHLGQRGRVRLVADPGFLAEAVVVRSNHTLGAANRTLSVWADLQGPSTTPLLHGMLARLTLVVAEPDLTLAVPQGAVFREGTHPYLFVRRSDGTFERRPVETGRSDDRFVEVRQGLREGERVAVQGIADLQTSYASLQK
jgi:RND family efflux transporter MFP subunit